MQSSSEAGQTAGGGRRRGGGGMSLSYGNVSVSADSGISSASSVATVGSDKLSPMTDSASGTPALGNEHLPTVSTLKL